MQTWPNSSQQPIADAILKLFNKKVLHIEKDYLAITG
jgi:hypothetical protein